MKTISIKCKNRAEKLAAIYFLSGLTGTNINQILLSQTLKGRQIKEFPFVFVSLDSMDGSKIAYGASFGFSELTKAYYFYYGK